MAEGIRIEDAALEISPAGLEALVNRQGAEVRVTRLDLSVSPEALNALLRGLAPEGAAPPSAEVSDGRLQLAAEQDGKRLALDLQVGNLRVELTAGGLRLVSEPPADE
jgi:hypothetical protein